MSKRQSAHQLPDPTITTFSFCACPFTVPSIPLWAVAAAVVEAELSMLNVVECKLDLGRCLEVGKWEEYILGMLLCPCGYRATLLTVLNRRGPADERCDNRRAWFCLAKGRKPSILVFQFRYHMNFVAADLCKIKKLESYSECGVDQRTKDQSPLQWAPIRAPKIRNQQSPDSVNRLTELPFIIQI